MQLPSTWFIAVPALIILLLSLGAIFLPFGPRRKKWPFIMVAIINAATVVVVVMTPKVKVQDVPELPTTVEDNSGKGPAEAFWVNRDGVEKHSCPSAGCGVVGRLSFRDPVALHGSDGAWVRISEARKALCVNGRTRIIREGNDRCDPANGIYSGVFYEWIPAEYLSKTLPSSGSAETDEYESIVSGSENFRIHRDVFAGAAKDLVEAGTCTKEELADQGGFSRAAGASGPSVYIAYCGGDTMSDRVFLDVKSKELFR